MVLLLKSCWVKFAHIDWSPARPEVLVIAVTKMSNGSEAGPRNAVAAGGGRLLSMVRSSMSAVSEFAYPVTALTTRSIPRSDPRDRRTGTPVRRTNV
jgi:hypothetical protein